MMLFALARNGYHVFADEGLQLEHDAYAGADGGLGPLLEGSCGRVRGSLHLILGGNGDTGDQFLGGGVMDVNKLGGLGFHKLVVDEQLGRRGFVHERSRGGVEPGECPVRHITRGKSGEGQHLAGLWVGFGASEQRRKKSNRLADFSGLG